RFKAILVTSLPIIIVSNCLFQNACDRPQEVIEIRNRPCLWDNRINQYTKKLLKTQMWTEVAQEACINYDRLEEFMKREAVLNKRRNKWKGIRSSFLREIERIIFTSSRSRENSRRKPYLYFELLQFLVPCINLTDSTTPNIEGKEASESLTKDAIDSQDITTDDNEEDQTPDQRRTKPNEVFFKEELLLVNLNNALKTRTTERFDNDKHSFRYLLPDIKKVKPDSKMKWKMALVTAIINIRMVGLLTLIPQLISSS
ncbi:uncharacterized protein LOC106646526, partial [Copidosoma floridanum]|uniref:uncharacterized protein LOC106646526 n=1 Tax=Copidosoma floridanum TaxID=29053 RepID=UPI0006C998F0